VAYPAAHSALHALTVTLLAASAVLYTAGVVRLWRKAGGGRGIGYGNAAAFLLGWLVLAACVVSPLHHLAAEFLWIHMVQHELIMVVAAPLLVMGRPMEAFAWVLRLRVRLPGDPWLAWAFHAAVLWGWHAPGAFGQAVESEAWHFVQHASFLASALLFWWTVLAPRNRSLAPMLSLFTTMLHTGALGALMTFAAGPWYAGYTMEDQQLAGLVMWIPAGLAYPLAALACAAAWLRSDAAPLARP
jgi:putative membrane protein